MNPTVVRSKHWARGAARRGSFLVATATDQRQLAVPRFGQASAVLACIGLAEEIMRLAGTLYGNTLLCLGWSGPLSRYRFGYLPGADVSGLLSNALSIRFRSPTASSEDFVGNFTDWQSTTLQGDAEVILHSRCPLSAGVHEYMLLVDGHRWDVDRHVIFRPGPAGESNYVHVVTRA
jgi:hypothetical protein